MVTDLFGNLLQELGSLLEIKDLAPDSNNSCLLKLKNGTQIQMEFDKSEQFLIVGSAIATIPAGRYRENIFREALKSNGLFPPQQGIFAYSKNNDQLILFEMVPLKDLTGAKIHERLTTFSEKVKTWNEAITRGDVPQVGDGAIARIKGMFGL